MITSASTLSCGLFPPMPDSSAFTFATHSGRGEGRFDGAKTTDRQAANPDELVPAVVYWMEAGAEMQDLIWPSECHRELPYALRVAPEGAFPSARSGSPWPPSGATA
jgi:hypothetical protein